MKKEIMLYLRLFQKAENPPLEVIFMGLGLG